MLNPSIGKLIKNYQSRYQLVIDVAKYARHFSERADEGKLELTGKPVDMALVRLAENFDDE